MRRTPAAASVHQPSAPEYSRAGRVSLLIPTWAFMVRRLARQMEILPEDLHALGGRALTSELVAREVPPNCDPLGPENKLVIAPGILSGTVAVNSGRLSIGAKSPLTGGIKESNVGGNVSQRLARLGVAAVIVEGCAPSGTHTL